MNEHERKHLASARRAVQVCVIATAVTVGEGLMNLAGLVDYGDSRDTELKVSAVAACAFLAFTVAACALYQRDKRRVARRVAQRRQL